MAESGDDEVENAFVIEEGTDHVCPYADLFRDALVWIFDSISPPGLSGKPQWVSASSSVFSSRSAAVMSRP